MSKQKKIYSLLKQVFGQANVLTVPVILLKKLDGDHATALFLSQLIYWSDKTANVDGWIRKSYSDWETEIFVKKDKAMKIKKTLEELGLIQTQVVKTTCAPTVHYKVDEEALIDFLFSEEALEENDVTESENSSFEKSEKPTFGNPKVGNAHYRKWSKPTIDSGQSPLSIGNIDYDIDYDIDYKNSPLGGERAKVPKKTKTPLRLRQPVNDFEIVEKAYLHSWDELYSSGIVHTKDPIVNWTQGRKLLQGVFKTMQPSVVVNAIYKAKQDSFILDGGFSLTTILSTSVLNRLINSHYKTPEKKVSQYRKSAVIQSDTLQEGDYL